MPKPGSKSLKEIEVKHIKKVKPAPQPQDRPALSPRPCPPTDT